MLVIAMHPQSGTCAVQVGVLLEAWLAVERRLLALHDPSCHSLIVGVVAALFPQSDTLLMQAAPEQSHC